MNIKNKNKGFTLIELLVVVAVIAILGTVAVTAYVGTTLKASRSEAYANLSAMKMFQDSYFAERGRYSGVQADFPGFEPWTAGAFTEFTYTITAAPNTCFLATATGNVNTRVFGDVFTIDCNDIRNF